MYLIKERVVSLLDPGPVGLVAHRDLHHWLDVVARQLTGLDDPYADLVDTVNAATQWTATYLSIKELMS